MKESVRFLALQLLVFTMAGFIERGAENCIRTVYAEFAILVPTN